MVGFYNPSQLQNIYILLFVLPTVDQYFATFYKMNILFIYYIDKYKYLMILNREYM